MPRISSSRSWWRVDLYVLAVTSSLTFWMAFLEGVVDQAASSFTSPLRRDKEMDGLLPPSGQQRLVAHSSSRYFGRLRSATRGTR